MLQDTRGYMNFTMGISQCQSNTRLAKVDVLLSRERELQSGLLAKEI